MLKWRMKRGVTGLRPPPGGAHADTIVTSCVERSNLGQPAEKMIRSALPNIRTQKRHSFEDLL